jgi:prepilin signal peptidase PulO-like enzyme (type II secretory pathway)
MGLFSAIKLIGIKKTGKDLIGYGDIKLLAVLSIFFQLPVTLIGLWLSSLVALISIGILRITNFHFEGNKVPFGFFIGLTFISIRIFDNTILALFQKLSMSLWN